MRPSLHDRFCELNFEDLLDCHRIRFQGINFRGCSEILKNSEIYCPQKFPTIQYNKIPSVAIEGSFIDNKNFSDPSLPYKLIPCKVFLQHMNNGGYSSGFLNSQNV